MKPPSKNLMVWRGNTSEFAFRLKVDADTPFDLTGSTIVMSIVYKDGRVDLSSVDNKVLIADPSAGEFSVPISAELSRSIAPDNGQAQYEIERRIGDEQTTILYGVIRLEGGVNAD